MLMLLCYARRRGLGLSVSMTDVSMLIKGQIKVATLTHIWVDWFVGTWGNPVLSKGDPRVSV